MENMGSVMKKPRSDKKARMSKEKARQEKARQERLNQDKENAQQERMQQNKARQDRMRKQPPAAVESGRTKNVMGIELNAATAKTAIILSEIIGPPVSRRRKRR